MKTIGSVLLGNNKSDKGLNKVVEKVLKKKKKEGKPMQLQLFTFEDDNYSNLFSLFDLAPIFLPKKSKTLSSDAPISDTVREYQIVHNRSSYDIRITAGAIQDRKTKKQKAIFAGYREELVYTAIMKIATDAEHIFERESKYIVIFTLYQVQERLEEQGHKMRIADVREAIEVLHATRVEIEGSTSEDNDDEMIMSSYVFSDVGFRAPDGKEGKQENSEKSYGYVVLNEYVRRSIDLAEYRQFNFQVLMSVKSAMGRYLIKRLSARFTYAEKDSAYTVHLSTLFRDSGRDWSDRSGNNKRVIVEALEELKEKSYIKHYTLEPIKGRGRKIIDFEVKIFPHERFIQDCIKANKQSRLGKTFVETKKHFRATEADYQ